MKKYSNLSISKVSIRAIVNRDGLRRTRRFLVTKFGGKPLAINKAKQYVHFLKTCSDYQFENAIRRPGRPTMSEFFGRRLIKN